MFTDNTRRILCIHLPFTNDVGRTAPLFKADQHNMVVIVVSEFKFLASTIDVGRP